MKTPQSKSYQPAKAPRMPKGNDEGGRYVDRDLSALKNEETLVPTDAEPVSLHKRMAGAC